MANLVRKSVIIGLGGTGLKAILYLKKKLYESYGKIPLCYKFLVLDTADLESLETQGDEFKLEAGEFYRLSVEDPAEFINIRPEVKKWFPLNVPKRELVDGAGQIRALGRLGLYHHADEVYARLSAILRDVNNYKIGLIDQEQFELISDKRLVIVVGSLAGGTGSGTFIELGHIIRSLLQPVEKVLGMFMLPDPFEGLPGCDRVLPNGYAALKELDSAMNESARSQRSFTFGNNQIDLKYTPYNRIFLINNSAQESKFTFDSLDSLNELMATGILVATGAVGKKDGDVWDNLGNQLKSTNDWLGQAANYGSYGVSELVFDRDSTLKNTIARISADILDKCFINTGASSYKSSSDELTAQLRLREDDSNSDLLNSILSKSDIFLPSKPEPTTDNLKTLLGQRTSFIENQIFQLRETANQRVESITDQTMKKLDETIREMIRDDNHRLLTKNTLEELKALIQEFNTYTVNERLKNQKLLGTFDSTYNQINEDAKHAYKRMFGGANARSEVIDSYIQNVSDHLNAIMDDERRRAITQLYAEVITNLNSWLSQLETFEATIKALRSSLRDRIAKSPSGGTQSIKPFVANVSYPRQALSEISIENEAFTHWLKESKQLQYEQLIPKNSYDIKSLLEEFAQTQEIYLKIKSSTIEEVLALYPEDQREQFIKNLNKMAAPMWQYQTVYTSGKLVKICIFGTHDPDNSILEDKPKLKQIINLRYDPTNVANGDRLRIMCFKLEAIAPAYILERLSQYKNDYDRLDSICTFHLGTDYFNLPDIMPIKGDEESRKYWSIGLAPVFNLISSNVTAYYFRSKLTGRKVDDYLVSLGSGRQNAMVNFLESNEFVQESMKEIESCIQKLGKVEVASKLREYHDRLLQEIKAKNNVKSDLRELINKEVEDIDSFIEELESFVEV